MSAVHISTSKPQPFTFESFKEAKYTSIIYSIVNNSYALFQSSDKPVYLHEIAEACPQLESLTISTYKGSDLSRLPLHLLPNLKKLSIRAYEVHALPTLWEYAIQLEILILNVPEQAKGLKELSEKVHLLTNLYYLQPPKTSNLIWLNQLTKLPALQTLDLSSYTTLPFSVPIMIEWMKAFPCLKEIINFYPKKNEILTESILGLDFLEHVELISPLFKTPTNLPLFFGKFKHVNLHGPRSIGYKEVNTFRERYASNDLSETHRNLLFLCWIKSWNRVKDCTENHLLEKHKQQKPVHLAGYDKLSSINKTTLKAKLKDTQVIVDKKGKEETVWILHSKSNWELLENVILENQPFITEEQLKEYLDFLVKPYFLEVENEDLSQNIIRLIASEDTGNLLLAFEMIQNGGATIAIQSMVAAIALAHTETAIRKKAKQAYIKTGSAAFVPLMGKSSYKRTDFNLRLSKHDNISQTDFLLMIDFLEYVEHKKYYSDARFSLAWERLDLKEITENIALFPNLEIVELAFNTELNMDQVLSLLSQIINLKTVRLNSCKRLIPPVINQLQSLEELDISSNQMEDFTVLSQLKNLQQLTLKGCKIKNWDWLLQCPKLQWVCVSSADQEKFPSIGKKRLHGDTFLQLR